MINKELKLVYTMIESSELTGKTATIIKELWKNDIAAFLVQKQVNNCSERNFNMLHVTSK